MDKMIIDYPLEVQRGVFTQSGAVFLAIYFLPKKAMNAVRTLVHNCTIFLCSLDVRNIVQGGTPYMRVFFLHRALEAILDQNECVFLQKTTV